MLTLFRQGAKSLVFLAYEISTEYVKSLQRWRSYKANTILNGLDIAFWGAVAFLNLQANLNSCDGISCYLGWGVAGVAVVVKYVPENPYTIQKYQLTAISPTAMFTSSHSSCASANGKVLPEDTNHFTKKTDSKRLHPTAPAFQCTATLPTTQQQRLSMTKNV